MNPLSGLTMYDALTMLVSGYMWNFLFLPENMRNEKDVMFWVVCYIVGLVYHRILDWFASAGLDCLRNNESMLKKSHRKVRKEYPQRMKKKPIKDDYYEAYYNIMKNNSLGNIATLEAQVAFIRDIVPILGVYFIGLCFFEFEIYEKIEHLFGGRCCAALLLLASMAILIVVRYISQKKIYELVWEGSCFIQDKEDEEKNNR